MITVSSADTKKTGEWKTVQRYMEVGIWESSGWILELVGTGDSGNLGWLIRIPTSTFTMRETLGYQTPEHPLVVRLAALLVAAASAA